MSLVSVFDRIGSAARPALDFVHLALGFVFETVIRVRRLGRLVLLVLLLDGIRGARSHVMHLVGLALRLVLHFLMHFFGDYNVGRCRGLATESKGGNARGVGRDGAE